MVFSVDSSNATETTTCCQGIHTQIYHGLSEIRVARLQKRNIPREKSHFEMLEEARHAFGAKSFAAPYIGASNTHGAC